MEKAHDISLDEPCVAHQAILFMLDVLMRNNKPTLTLDELYDSFGDKSFTPQMLRAVGGNEQGLKQFLLRYPSLFTVNGDLISANSGGNQLPRTSITPERYLRKTKSGKLSMTINSDGNESSSNSSDLINSSSSSSSSSSSTSSNVNGTSQPIEPQYDSKTMKEIEQEAIAFFRKQISKREEDWLPIVSVAGHASQSSADVRKFVGPQNEFKAFLMKYPHIFVVREEYCGLKGKADVSSAPFPPPSPPPKRRLPSTVGLSNGIGVGGGVLSRNHSFKNTNRYSACGNLMPNTPTGLIHSSSSLMSQSIVSTSSSIISNNSINNGSISANSNGGSIIGSNNPMSKPRLTPVEVKAVHYVMRILHKNGRMLLQTIPGLISRAPDQVSNIVGFTREDLIQFFKRHSAIFQLHPDGCVSVKQDAVKALILKDAANSSTGVNNNLVNANNGVGSDGAGIITNNGVVLRIFPKYGILNMDNNEQVFFDIQSCQFETFSDLTTILHTGDRLYFNAVIGPRDGSTKWRSLKTWIKMKPQTNGNSMMPMLDNVSSHSDADKSDDSSTSSSHGGFSNSGGRHHYHHQLNNNNIYHTQQQNGFYIGSGGQTTPTQSILGLSATSPTGTAPVLNGNPLLNNSNTSSNCITNSMIANTNNSIGLNQSGNCIDEINNTNSCNNTNLNNNSLTNSVTNNLSGDFNQYQLDNGDYNQTTNSNSNVANAGDDSTEASSPNHSSNLIHSTSANNLITNNSNQQNSVPSNNTTNNTNKPSALSSSKSIHSFNLPSNETTTLNSPNTTNSSIEHQLSSINLNNTSSTKKIDADKSDLSANGSAANSVTKFMKQSPDNISQREVSSTNNEKISIGCQTISTGDITVTNVYIDADATSL